MEIDPKLQSMDDFKSKISSQGGKHLEGLEDGKMRAISESKGGKKKDPRDDSFRNQRQDKQSYGTVMASTINQCISDYLKDNGLMTFKICVLGGPKVGKTNLII